MFSRRLCRSCYLPFPVIFILWLLFTGSLLYSAFANYGLVNRSTSERGTVEDRRSLFAPKLNHIFSYQEDMAGPLKIPYKILAGVRPPTKKFISIGISTVKRKKENYLLDTLQSIFSQSRESDIEDMVLVVYLADWGPAVRKQVAQEVSVKFHKQLAARQLLLVTSPWTAYPTLDGLKRNYGDSEDRVRYRSKQNVDYAFLSNFCAGLARYHLVLEDDVRCSRNFLLSIRRKVEAYSKPWTNMAFSNLGYTGKLYHSIDLRSLARFLLLFYDEMPCDLLQRLFFYTKAQPETLYMRPYLFQHMGTNSSFQEDLRNPLAVVVTDMKAQPKMLHTRPSLFQHMGSFRGHANKDNDFHEEPRDNPPAVVFTDMKAHQENTLQVVYEGRGFFWGYGVSKGSHISVQFVEPAVLRRVRVFTGSLRYRRDILRSGIAEVGWRGAQGGDRAACQTYQTIGHFVQGALDVKGLGLGARKAVDCLRLRVTEDQKDWLLLRDISVWTEKRGDAR